MKNSVHFRFGGLFQGSLSLAFLLVGLGSWHPAFAENVQEARVTRIVKDVKLVGGNAAARPAVVSDQVRPGNGVRTGTDSRAELTFSDLSITRLGANTVFSFNGAGRTVDLGGGAVLVEAPPNSAAIHVNTAAFSAAISGVSRS
jgi:ferric-dicitrate binding protein FerR (iron transport regulator)